MSGPMSMESQTSQKSWLSTFTHFPKKFTYFRNKKSRKDVTLIVILQSITAHKKVGTDFNLLKPKGGGRSAIKFRKSQIRKFADLNFFFKFGIRNFRIYHYKICGFAICWLANLGNFRFGIAEWAKNLRICDLWTNKKIWVPTFDLVRIKFTEKCNWKLKNTEKEEECPAVWYRPYIIDNLPLF